MLYPVMDYGTEFPVFKYQPEQYGDVMILLSEENTTITEDGVQWDEMYGPNTYFVGSIYNGLFISADKPFYVAQVLFIHC